MQVDSIGNKVIRAFRLDAVRRQQLRCKVFQVLGQVSAMSPGGFVTPPVGQSFLYHENPSSDDRFSW
jgi:hypothetical protein